VSESNAFDKLEELEMD